MPVVRIPNIAKYVEPASTASETITPILYFLLTYAKRASPSPWRDISKYVATSLRICDNVPTRIGSWAGTVTW